MTPLSPAAALIAVPGAVLSHEEAARQYGIELRDDTGVRRLTVPRNYSHVLLAGWKVRRCDVESRVLATGMRVTLPEQSVVDLARVLPLEAAVVSGDSALRLRLTTLAVVTELANGCRGRGRPEARSVAGMLDPRSGSMLETLFRVLVVMAGLPAPESQVQIADGREIVGRFDFVWREERLVVELDGYAFHSDRISFEKDRKRANSLERLGWRLLRFTWEDVTRRPQYVLALVRDCLRLAA